jgi:hypothetical protein
LRRVANGLAVHLKDDIAASELHRIRKAAGLYVEHQKALVRL